MRVATRFLNRGELNKVSLFGGINTTSPLPHRNKQHALGFKSPPNVTWWFKTSKGRNEKSFEIKSV